MKTQTEFKNLLGCSFAALAALFAGASNAQADVVTGADLGGVAGGAVDLGLSTFTTTAQNGLLTVTGSGNFGGNSARFGIFGGTNNAALDDGDGVLGGGDAESMNIILNAVAADNIGALQSISWDFSRAQGAPADSGVFISGFTSDPLAALSGPGLGTSTVSYASGVVALNLTNGDFGGDDTTVTFGNVLASAGQTLTVTIADADQAAPQIAFTSITAVAVPEPSSLAILGFAGLGMMARRRR